MRLVSSMSARRSDQREHRLLRQDVYDGGRSWTAVGESTAVVDAIGSHLVDDLLAGLEYMHAPKLLLTEAEAAKALALSPRMVRKMVDAGDLPVVYAGRAKRYPLEALRAWIADRATSRPPAPLAATNLRSVQRAAAAESRRGSLCRPRRRGASGS